MTAIFSPCGRYRYYLTDGDSEHAAAFVLLNPSTAGTPKPDGTEADDPTARRMRGFAADWGYRSIVVGNLYGLQSPKPAALWNHPDPVGPLNDEYLRLIAYMPLIVVGWGNEADPERAEQVCRILTAQGAQLWCLGRNANGTPGHPLYLPYSRKLQAFTF